MSNLKKVLSLVLALALAMTMCAGAINTELPFSDKSGLTADQQDALCLLYAIGVVEGMGDGTVGTGNLTRAEMSKIAYLLYNGQDDSAKYAGSTSFTDVDAEAWFAQYINWAFAAKVVNGYGSGKFGPTDNVTGIQAVAMVTRMLGVDTTGANWESEAKNAAVQLGIVKGIVTKNFYNTAITRGDMFILLANALLNSDIAKDVYGLDILTGAVLSSADTVYNYSVYTFKYYNEAKKAYVDYKFKFVVDAKANAEDFGKKFILVADMRDADKDLVFDLYAAYEMADSSTYKTYTGKVVDVKLTATEPEKPTFIFDAACKYYVNNTEKAYAVFAAAFAQKNPATYTCIDTDGDGDIDYAYVQALALADITTKTIEGKITARDAKGNISIDGTKYAYGNYYDAKYTAIKDTIKADVYAVAGADTSTPVVVSDVIYTFVVDDNYVYTIAMNDKTQYAGNYALIEATVKNETLRGLPYLLWMTEENVVVDGYLKNLNNGRGVIDDLDTSDLVYIVSYDGTYVEMLTAGYLNNNYTNALYEAPDFDYTDAPVLYKTTYKFAQVVDLSTLKEVFYVYIPGTYALETNGNGTHAAKEAAYHHVVTIDEPYSATQKYYTRTPYKFTKEALTEAQFNTLKAANAEFYVIWNDGTFSLIDDEEYENNRQYGYASAYYYTPVVTNDIVDYNKELYYTLDVTKNDNFDTIANVFGTFNAAGVELYDVVVGTVENGHGLYNAAQLNGITKPGYYSVSGPRMDLRVPYLDAETYYLNVVDKTFTVYFDFAETDGAAETQIYKVNDIWRLRNYYDVVDMIMGGKAYVLVNGVKMYIKYDRGENFVGSTGGFYYAVDGNDPGTVAGDQLSERTYLEFSTELGAELADYLRDLDSLQPSKVYNLNASKGVIFAYGKVAYGSYRAWKAYHAEDFYFADWGHKDYKPDDDAYFEGYERGCYEERIYDELIYTVDTTGNIYVKAMKVSVADNDILPTSWINADAKLYFIDGKTGAMDSTKGYEVKVFGFNGAVDYIWIKPSMDIGRMLNGCLILAVVDENGIVTDITYICDDYVSAVIFVDQNYTGDKVRNNKWDTFNGTTFARTDRWGNDGYTLTIDPTKTVFLMYDISEDVTYSVSADVAKDASAKGKLAAGEQFHVFEGYSYNIVTFTVD